MKTQNRRYPRSSGMDGDKSGESGVFLCSRRIPDFCDHGQRSFSTNENSNLYRQGRWQWILLITNSLNCWASVSLSHICAQISIFGALSISHQIQHEMNLGQTSGNYPIHPQNLSRLEKSKIPDHLGFSGHMKTRLEQWHWWQQWEHQKSNSKTTTLHVKTPFWKMPNFTFYGGRKQATMSFSFSF